MIKARKAALIAVLAAVAATAGADQHPNSARGFDIGKPYQMNGIDNVNLFNGNLTVTIPIGQRYHVNGNLSYGLSLVYSGNVWDVVESELLPCLGTLVRRTYPNRRSNAGIGWLLSLGRLFGGNQYPITETAPGSWHYETPDGALHTFYPTLHDGQTSPDPDLLFTRDGSYLRLKIGTADRTVEFPDGTYQVFEEMQRVDDGTWTVATSPTGVWRLRSIRDRFGNTVTVNYASALATQSAPLYPEIWTIADGSRTQKVYFVSATAPYDAKLDHVELSAFNGTATWSLAYGQQELAAGEINTGCSGTNVNWTVPMLTSVTAPPVNQVSQVYSMLDPNNPAVPYYVISTGVNRKNGHLKGLQLPTKGWLEWDYLVHVFFSGSVEGIAKSVVVTTRRMMAADRTAAHTSTWTYGRKQAASRVCTDPNNPGEGWHERPEQLVVSVTSPEGVTSVHYFSTFERTVSACVINSVFEPEEYSLAFSRAVSKTTGGRTRFLSQETYSSVPTLPEGPGASADQYRATGGTLVRSEWVEYERDAGDINWNARESAHVTVYGDDRGDTSGQFGGAFEYEGVTRYQFDDFGHYRQASTGGNYLTGNFRTTLVNYPARTLTGTWLLNTYTERCVVDDGTTERQTNLQQCTGSSGPLADKAVATKFCFSDTTGFLQRNRTMNGRSDATANATIVAAANDVIAVFTPDGAGNVQQEQYFGGDTQSVTTSDSCSASLPTPKYTTANTYSFGALATSKYEAQAGQQNPNFFNVENTINASTGLISKSKDVAGQETNFEYDALGRMTMQAPPSGLASTSVVYSEATGSTSARATATTSTGTSQLKTTNIFDDFGRLLREEKVLPGGTSARETVYTGSGWTQKVSEWAVTPSNFTEFSNFDAFGRPRLVTAPDGATTTITFTGGSKVERKVTVAGLTGPVDAITTETYDRQKRLQKVDEPGGISSTVYSYDAADHLTEVSMTVGGVTQPRKFVYDKRGFLTSEEHPESGVTTYDGFDARGHVGRKLQGTVNAGFDLKYEYDAAERLTKVHQLLNRAPESTQPLKEFIFGTTADATNFTLGRLTDASRHNYLATGDVTVLEQYKYFNYGQVKEKKTQISGATGSLQSFKQTYDYNSLGLLSTLTYPTCTDPARPCGAAGISSISPTYQNGLVTGVANFAPTITYALNGMLSEITHAGSVVDTITPDSNGMPRPRQIKFATYDSCTPPTIIPNQQPADAQVAPNGSTTLSVGATGTGTLTYQWFKDGSSIPIGGACTGSSCPTGALTATSRYIARIFNSCGKVDSREATVTVCGAPTVSVAPASTPYPGSSVQLTATPTGCGPFTYQWYIGTSGDPNSTQTGSNSPILHTGLLSVTTRYWVKVTDSGGNANSNTAVVTVPLPMPSTISASVEGTNAIRVSWGASAGAHHYQFQRQVQGSWSAAVNVYPANPQAPSTLDSGLLSTTTYVYRVRAVDVDGGSESAYRGNDLATTMAFTAIQSGVTVVGFGHFDQVRTAINAIRGAAGAGTLSWTDLLAGYPGVPPPASGGPIKGAHLLALRAAMDAALSAVGVSTPGYTDSISTSTLIRAVHINELQQRAQ